MRDFPIFSTEYGVASLVLREIPYRKEAYIRILEVQEGMTWEHLAQCAAFCRMAGAEKIYAAGEGLDGYPAFTTLLEMRGRVSRDDGPPDALFPVTAETVGQWRTLYNQSMVQVDTARTLEKRDESTLLEKPGAYFVHDRGELLGIGWLQDHRLLAVAALRKGAGERVLRTLLSTLDEEEVVLDVASTNRRAIALYEKLGFLVTRPLTQWVDCTQAGTIDDSGNL